MKKVKQISYVVAAGATAMTLNSCNKYDDGPGMSLMTKKSRVAGEWEVKSIDGETMTQGYTVNMEFEKNGIMTYSYTLGSTSYTYAGTWDFASDKENLVMIVDGGSQVYEIKKLENKEMWLDDDASSAVGQIWKLESK